MARRNLDRSYIYAGRHYGPGEVDVPEGFAAALDARDAVQAAAEPPAAPELTDANVVSYINALLTSDGGDPLPASLVSAYDAIDVLCERLHPAADATTGADQDKPAAVDLSTEAGYRAALGDLVALPGIGEKGAGSLIAAGFVTPDAVAAADDEALIAAGMSKSSVAVFRKALAEAQTP